MNGKLLLPLRKNKHFTVFGGPYADRPVSMYGLKLAKEIDLPCDIDLPIIDFSVPKKAAMDAALAAAVDQITQGLPLYVGCMAGRGRTGLFLAVLAKAFGVKSPVPYVRRKYFEHAVESPEQYKFVTRYRVPPEIKKAIRRMKIMSYFGFGLQFGYDWNRVMPKEGLPVSINPFYIKENMTRWNGNDTRMFPAPNRKLYTQPFNLPDSAIAKGKLLTQLRDEGVHLTDSEGGGDR